MLSSLYGTATKKKKKWLASVKVIVSCYWSLLSWSTPQAEGVDGEATGLTQKFFGLGGCSHPKPLF